jgi:hypothetical protein
LWRLPCLKINSTFNIQNQNIVISILNLDIEWRGVESIQVPHDLSPADGELGFEFLFAGDLVAAGIDETEAARA